jgi:hypothetical protein
MGVFLFGLLWLQALQIPLPDGPSAWTVVVVTSGGFTGKGDGFFSASSEGKILCRELKCPDAFKAADFQSLVETILPASLPVVTLPPVTVCNDCIKRTMTITRRDAGGILHTYTATWDETTKGRLPPEINRLYDAFTAIMK